MAGSFTSTPSMGESEPLSNTDVEIRSSSPVPGVVAGVVMTVCDGVTDALSGPVASAGSITGDEPDGCMCIC